ncbi:dienelactone hydrolase family protein [Streptomyces sp. NPDC048193]|uniref:dienelactone hydrolase family protein n=1 Tax=unclassified Streptomyces TaxID=2593676 RepID=UPI00344911B8
MPVKTLQIPTADGHADAFAAFPDRGERHPGVLMYPDGFGVRPVLRDMARELAGHGYYVLVPNVFYRHGPAPVIDLPEYIGEDDRAAVLARLMPLIEAHTVDRVLRDADAYLRSLTAQPEVVGGPVAVTGYCIGGLLATRTAAAHPGRVAALAAFHAPVGADGADALSGITAEVHFGHAASDLTPDGLRELNEALEAAEVDHTSEIYPGTVHGFTMADTDAFDPGALQLHWERLLPLLGRSLAGGRGVGQGAVTGCGSPGTSPACGSRSRGVRTA